MMQRWTLRLLCHLLALFVLCWTLPAGAAVDPADVPLFHWRARVTSAGGKEPGDAKFTYRFDRGPVQRGDASAWSQWAAYDLEQVKDVLGPHSYPNVYLKRYPVVLHLVVSPVVDPTLVEVEISFDELATPTQPADGADAPAGAVRLQGELMGPKLGMLLWRGEKRVPLVDTMAGYNREHYWKVFDTVELPKHPSRFPIIERLIAGDDDRRDWNEGIAALAKAGFNSLMLPPNQKIHEMAVAHNRPWTAWAIYNPPSYFAYSELSTQEALDLWAQKLAEPYTKAGYAPADMKAYAVADEPGWYYPAAFEQLEKEAGGLKAFREYLQAQNLTPADVGAKSWDEVKPLGRHDAKDLAGRRLFYWSMRFFAWDSARCFARVTKAMEKAFTPGVAVFTNWNFFAGRLYVPGPVANNSAKKDPNAAMGGHDWLEFGRMRGGNVLWTEDWFGDGLAYQWSFYCAKLRSAAELGQVEFGGYVVPRSAGQREEGILQKIVAVAGSGGKVIKYFVFGPEYNFPGNCYSENVKVLPKMAEAHGMIALAEDLLWPGRMPKPEVAILMPRSAQMWDARDIEIPNQIQDATNNHMNNSTVDYMAEVYDLYVALQHANIPVQFVDEDDLAQPAALAPYRVLYVTEPNVPVEGQQGLATWTKAGGTLVTVTGAAMGDRYDEPCSVLAQAVGITEKPRERLLTPSLAKMPALGEVTGRDGSAAAIGPRGQLASNKASVLAAFADGSPALLQTAVGKGQVFHFAFMPGMSYFASSKEKLDNLPVGFSPRLRAWITAPVTAAKVTPRVQTSIDLVEAPLLVSEGGAVVTLLNWTGKSQEKLTVRVRLPFRPSSVESVKKGNLTFSVDNGVLSFTLPVGAADFVMLRK